MPEMDGLELAKSIAADAVLRRTRVVILTSLGQIGEQEEARAARVAACLTKPVRQARLFDILARVVTESPGRRPKVAPTASRPPRQPSLGEAGIPGIPILVVEDSEVNRQVARGMLEKLGYSPDVVGNGLEALTALRGAPYAAVLMDCQMPDMDGYEATRELRRREAHGGGSGPARRTPIIAMTAHAMAGAREDCLAAGMDDYVAKPVRIDELDAVLRRWAPASNALSSTVGGQKTASSDPRSPTTDHANGSSTRPYWPICAGSRFQVGRISSRSSSPDSCRRRRATWPRSARLPRGMIRAAWERRRTS